MGDSIENMANLKGWMVRTRDGGDGDGDVVGCGKEGGGG